MPREDLEQEIEFLTTQTGDRSARLDEPFLETERDAENICALARIAKRHHKQLEGGETE